MSESLRLRDLEALSSLRFDQDSPKIDQIMTEKRTVYQHQENMNLSAFQEDDDDHDKKWADSYYAGRHKNKSSTNNYGI